MESEDSGVTNETMPRGRDKVLYLDRGAEFEQPWDASLFEIEGGDAALSFRRSFSRRPKVCCLLNHLKY